MLIYIGPLCLYSRNVPIINSSKSSTRLALLSNDIPLDMLNIR